MPDDELFRLAGEGKLRANLAAQFKRMLADPKSNEFVRHFVGQWLQVRAVDAVQINARGGDLPRRSRRTRRPTSSASGSAN